MSARMPAEAESTVEAAVAPDFSGSRGLAVFCDGCFEPVSRTGGWAFVVVADGADIASGHGGASDTGNNAMELAALIEAARWLTENAPGMTATLWTDSAYAVSGWHQWRPIWKSWNWRKKVAGRAGRSRAVADAALWQALDAALEGAAHVSVAWCKGHAGIAGNERADRLAETGRMGGSAAAMLAP